MRSPLKRLAALLLVLFPLVLAACGQPQPSPEVQGQWEGNISAMGSSVPVRFTVDREYRVEDSSFHLTYPGGYIDYSVTSTVVGNSLSIDAVASSPDGKLTFTLRASVTDDRMTGNYELVGVDKNGTEFLTAKGTFNATRPRA